MKVRIQRRPQESRSCALSDRSARWAYNLDAITARDRPQDLRAGNGEVGGRIVGRGSSAKFERETLEPSWRGKHQDARRLDVTGERVRENVIWPSRMYQASSSRWWTCSGGSVVRKARASTRARWPAASFSVNFIVNRPPSDQTESPSPAFKMNGARRPRVAESGSFVFDRAV